MRKLIIQIKNNKCCSNNNNNRRKAKIRIDLSLPLWIINISMIFSKKTLAISGNNRKLFKKNSNSLEKTYSFEDWWLWFKSTCIFLVYEKFYSIWKWKLWFLNIDNLLKNYLSFLNLLIRNRNMQFL